MHKMLYIFGDTVSSASKKYKFPQPHMSTVAHHRTSASPLPILLSSYTLAAGDCAEVFAGNSESQIL